MTVGTLNSSLQTALSLFKGNRNALRFANPYWATNKDYQNHLIGQNIVLKAAQLVNDLESARNSKITFQDLVAQKQAELKATTSLSVTGLTRTNLALTTRGSVIDQES